MNNFLIQLFLMLFFCCAPKVYSDPAPYNIIEKIHEHAPELLLYLDQFLDRQSYENFAYSNRVLRKLLLSDFYENRDQKILSTVYQPSPKGGWGAKTFKKVSKHSRGTLRKALEKNNTDRIVSYDYAFEAELNLLELLLNFSMDKQIIFKRVIDGLKKDLKKELLGGQNKKLYKEKYKILLTAIRRNHTLVTDFLLNSLPDSDPIKKNPLLAVCPKTNRPLATSFSMTQNFLDKMKDPTRTLRYLLSLPPSPQLSDLYLEREEGNEAGDLMSGRYLSLIFQTLKKYDHLDDQTIEKLYQKIKKHNLFYYAIRNGARDALMSFYEILSLRDKISPLSDKPHHLINSAGADWFLRDDQLEKNNTLLHIAAQWAQGEVFEEIFHRLDGDSTNMKVLNPENKDGDTPLDFALANRNIYHVRSFADMLSAFQIKVQNRNEKHFTKIARMILEVMSDDDFLYLNDVRNWDTNNNHVPLTLIEKACMGGNLEIVKYMVERLQKIQKERHPEEDFRYYLVIGSGGVSSFELYRRQEQIETALEAAEYSGNAKLVQYMESLLSDK